MLALEYDVDQKVIKGVSSGFLTLDDVRAYALQLARFTRQAREAHGMVRLYLDSRDAAIQTGEVMAAFAATPSVISNPKKDRVAVVVSSSLSKLQMSRNFNSECERAFTSPEEAMAWLLSD